MSRASTRRAAYAALLVVYALHNDLWLWDDPGMFLGLPVGLTYHIGYSLLAAVTMALLVRFAWPDELETAVDASPAGGRGIPTAEEVVAGPEGPGDGSDPEAPGDGGNGAEPEPRDDAQAGR